MVEIKGDNNKKALVVTTVASTLDQFCMNDINILQKSHKVYVATNFMLGNNTSNERVKEFKLELQSMDINVKEVNLNRNPFSNGNIIAFKEIKELIETNSFDIIHCHTPVAAMLVRLAARKVRKNGTRVIYTAHGFHFYKGAPLKNWLLYYLVERWLARYTDVLITINMEDYTRAKKSFSAKSIDYIPGVGIKVEKFGQVVVDKGLKRKEISLPEDAIVLLSVGELNKNKNHETVIKAIAKLDNPNIYYLICGQGTLETNLRTSIKELGLERKIMLLGFREDVAEIYKAADIFVFPSFREGLSVALMEAMASGLPVVGSNIRGNNDLIQNEKGGYLVKPDDIEGFAVAIKKVIDGSMEMGKFNAMVVKHFDLKSVMKEMARIYNGVQ